MVFLMVFHVFCGGVLAKLPCLALGRVSGAVFRRGARGAERPGKVRLTCQLGELCGIYGGCHKLFVGTGVMVLLPCMETGWLGG